MKKDRMNKLQWLGLILPAVALAGFPFTSGAVAKNAFKEMIHVLPEPWGGGLPVSLGVTAFGGSVALAASLKRRSNGWIEVIR